VVTPDLGPQTLPLIRGVCRGRRIRIRCWVGTTPLLF
jgi:hypothetical protein